MIDSFKCFHYLYPKGTSFLFFSSSSPSDHSVSLRKIEMPVIAVSQVEHGIVELVDSENPENPQITVLVDCEGLTPFRVPMQMMRYCSSLLQDHFPNRLGCLFIIRLPPVVRLLAQTFIQVRLFLHLSLLKI